MFRRHVVAVSSAVLACGFVAVGFVGVDRYARNYWLYRGFPPPSDPAYVTQPGTRQHIHVQFAPFAALLAPEADLRLDLPRVGIAALAAEAYLPFSGRGRP